MVIIDGRYTCAPSAASVMTYEIVDWNSSPGYDCKSAERFHLTVYRTTPMKALDLQTVTVCAQRL